MLEKLEFSIGGYFTGVKYAKLWTEDGKYFKSFKGDFRDPENIYTEEMLKDEIDFLENKLAELKINGWKKEYRPEGYVVCDGTQWNLEYKEVGKNCRHIYGDNALVLCQEIVQLKMRCFVGLVHILYRQFVNLSKSLLV